MSPTPRTLFYLLLALFFYGCSSGKEPAAEPAAKILVFYKTAGFIHTSIPVALTALQKLGAENNLLVDTTKIAANFNPANLANYRAVVFLSTTGDVLDNAQQQAFEQYIRAGHGFVGIHAATDTEYDWTWYNGLVGAYFKDHPAIQQATVRVTNKNHDATAFLPDAWQRTDEWYNFRDLNPGVQILANLDEQSYSGGVATAAAIRLPGTMGTMAVGPSTPRAATQTAATRSRCFCSTCWGASGTRPASPPG